MADISLYVGETHQTYTFTWQAGGVAVDLTGATITARFESATNSGVTFAGTGTTTVTSATTGVLTYKFAAQDVATAGEYDMQFKAVFGDGSVEYSPLVRLLVEKAV